MMHALIDTISLTAPEFIAFPPANDQRPFTVHVLATSESATASALRRAYALTRGFDPEIVLLVPHVVPYRQQLDHPAAPVAFTISRFQTLAELADAPVVIRVCVCRPEWSSLEPLLPRDAIVFVGGRKQRWWRSREERLADDLTGKGHRVVFVADTPSERLKAA